MKIRKTNKIQFKQNPILNKKIKKQEADTIKGVLLNTYIQKQAAKSELAEFDGICDSLLIPSEIKQKKEIFNNSNSFDYKKTIKPIAILSLATIASIVGASCIIKGYSGKMAKMEGIVNPPDLARNINILEEPHFAFYRALRDPSFRNIIGFGGVCLMSGITLAGKNLIDGIKEVWIKKQKCDIEHDFQMDMIDVETRAFKGKLDVVNGMLKNTSNYFKNVFSNGKINAFKNFISFKGKEKQEKAQENNKLKKIALIGAGAAAFIGISYFAFKNFQKTAKNLETFVQKYEDKEIKAKIENAVNLTDKNKAISELTNILKVINATEDTMNSNLSKIQGINEKEISDVIKAVKASQIYAKAPEALGGISEKIQYYCYINEERGHLYNWILNPENPFNKYLFLGFCAISSLGYLAHTIVEAIKEVAVTRENTRSELDLKKKLIEVEIQNFKSKKESAINPLIDDFRLQMKNGKPKEELKEVAQNILVEIKNGPPYVYS